MKKIFRSVLLILLAALCIASGISVLIYLRDYHAANNTYEAASSIALPPADESSPPPEQPDESEPDVSVPQPEEVPTPDEAAQSLMDTDLDALRQVNEKVLGWIHIPDSDVSYPLLQVSDNNEFLRRSWDGTPNNVGCIFMECSNQPDFSDLNTLIYGHFMKNGTMFGSLHYYRDQAYWDGHPYIYIVTDEVIRRYRVFSTYEADLVSDTYRIFPERNQRWQTALDYYVESSVISGTELPTAEDHILTLSTCTGTGTYHSRWVLQAYLDEIYPRNV